VWRSVLAITWTQAVISCRVNCCRRPVFKRNLVLTSLLTAVLLRPPQTLPRANFIFYNIDIGDLPTPIRRCSSRLRCRRFSISDVYIGRTLAHTAASREVHERAWVAVNHHCMSALRHALQLFKACLNKRHHGWDKNKITVLHAGCALHQGILYHVRQ